MWKALFEAITTGFQFFGRLLSRRQPDPEPEDKEEPTDPQGGRAGTAAGAAAHEASHMVGGKDGKN